MNRLREYHLPPRLYVEGLVCTRRFWLKYHHFSIYEELIQVPGYEILKTLLQPLLPDEVRYRIHLPTGTQISAWIPQEHLCIEYKTSKPHVSQIYSTWTLICEMEEYGIEGAEFQIWYQDKWKREAFELAKNLNLEAEENQIGLIALAIPAPTSEFRLHLERNRNILLADAEKQEPPKVKTRDKSPCRECMFFEFCHI